MRRAGPIPSVSVVVPLYNEEESLPRLCAELSAALGTLGSSSEVILVDDGSRDRTPSIARSISREDARFRLIRLRRNFGQTAALQAGIDHAQGRVIVTMDGDLQNDPADIPRLVAKLDDGFDIVCGWRRNRKDNLVHRKVPSWAANRLLRSITGVRIHDSGCSLKAYRAGIVRKARLYSDLHRFIPAITSLSGARIGELVVNHRPRTLGKTKYGISRTWRVMADLWMIKMVVGFTTRPGRWFALLGLPWLALACVSFVLSALAYLGADATAEPQIVPPTVTALFFFAFFHVVLIGVVSELVFRTGDYREREVIESHVVDQGKTNDG